METAGGLQAEIQTLRLGLEGLDFRDHGAKPEFLNAGHLVTEPLTSLTEEMI